MQPDTRFEIPAHVMSREMGGETVLLDLSQGAYYSLNGVGSRVWELLAEGMTLAEVSETLLAEYEVPPEDLDRDVLVLAHTLLTKQLVQLGH